MEIIENKTFDEERALYNLKDGLVKNCTFAGPKDGESVLKESRNIKVIDSKFSLRYPLWHVQKYELISSELDENTRAPIWYSNDGIIDKCNIKGVKLLRECNNIKISNSDIDSREFGWKCNDIQLNNSNIVSEYIFLDSKNVKCVFYNIPISFFAYENFFKMIREAAENYFANKLAFADSSEKIYCIQCAQLAFEKELKSKHSNGQKVFDKSLQSRMY